MTPRPPLPFLLLAASVSMLALAACGNKGPLVRPPPDTVEEAGDVVDPGSEDNATDQNADDAGIVPRDDAAPVDEVIIDDVPPPDDDGGGD